jgi:DNA (cytosine-5)-methyltransferase 1
MNVLDLFSGIGGFSLGLERAGMRTVAFCEINPYCRRVLAKRWPGVPCYDDIRSLTANCLAADGIAVDIICGGFPCQDLSVAQGASRAGLDGKRSGLWSDYARLIRELRPRFVIVENVPGLLSLGVGTVLGDLAEIGYDAEWQVISAAAAGAPHIRDRFWLVGYPNGDGQPAIPLHDETSRLPGLVADTDSEQHEVRCASIRRETAKEFPADADRSRLEIVLNGQAGQCAAAIGAAAWSVEPDVGRVAYGIPDRAHRIGALGNSVVPQIPEIIGRAIMTRALSLSSHDRGTA